MLDKWSHKIEKVSCNSGWLFWDAFGGFSSRDILSLFLSRQNPDNSYNKISDGYLSLSVLVSQTCTQNKNRRISEWVTWFVVCENDNALLQRVPQNTSQMLHEHQHVQSENESIKAAWTIAHEALDIQKIHCSSERLCRLPSRFVNGNHRYLFIN